MKTDKCTCKACNKKIKIRKIPVPKGYKWWRADNPEDGTVIITFIEIRK